ncbi:hypothetical protein D8674_014398 [Pyrus ussuriensis x Pyrus communis]|uniref:Uncharacterized protein n=1 Tax=Pyrus ussuriensis x Pyrus communis TaxID=2448454 RepID=A0A5N5GSI7_9ROSA|nr:hypothetical protein D8674_014398 [Pyrus ussuriensis x Pyrus communis]
MQGLSHKSLDSWHSVNYCACAFQLHGWRPFRLQQQQYAPASPTGRLFFFFFIDAIDMSWLTLVDDDRTISGGHHNRNGSFQFIAKNRRRRGSSGTRRCCSVGASTVYGTCSDFLVVVGTDSSRELFGNGDANWASNVSEARKSRKGREEGGGSGKKENVGGNESGYGSEPSYRGDVKFGYGDEFNEDEEDTHTVGENTFVDQKSHHRCWRKKHDCRMVDALRWGEREWWRRVEGTKGFDFCFLTFLYYFNI